MNHRLSIVLASIAAAVVLIVSTLLTVGGGTATAKQTQSPSAAIKAPSVANARAIRAKYHGQSITFLGDTAVGSSHTRDLMLVHRFSAQTGIRINLVPHPAASDAAYSQLVRNFSQHSSAIDVMMLDVIWPGSFAPFLIDLKRPLAREVKIQNAGIIANDTIKGRLIAMPWFGDFGILYYRTDLLRKYGFSHPPRTWAELGQYARVIQAGEQKTNKNFYGFVFQGNAYEGLTCDSLEWLASTGGGRFIQNGKVTIDNPTAAGMLNLVRSWIGTITPRGVTSYMEEDARIAFDGGNAAFMRNWPYAYSISQTSKVAGKFDVTVLPHAPGHKAVGTVGGWQLGVSKFSKHVGASIALVGYLTGPAVQRFDAIFNSNVPTIASVQRDPAVKRTNPYLKPSIANVMRVTRPSRFLGPHYQAGSQIIYQGINEILNGQDANSVLPGIAQRLKHLLSG